MKKFIEFAIDKPVLNHLFLLFLFVLSIFSYIQIPKEIFPPMQMDKIIITGGYSGSSADVLDKMAVNSIEDDLKNFSELTEIRTLVRNGSFQVIADIKEGVEHPLLLSEVKDIISNIKRDLPSDMNEPIVQIAKQNYPLALIAIAGDHDRIELLDIAQKLKSRLSSYQELSEIVIRGDADEQLVIRLNQQRIDAYGLDYDAVVRSLSSISAIFPIGLIKQKGEHLFISTINGEKDVGGVENIRVTIGNRQLFIKDIADISFELEESTEISHYNGKRNISVDLKKSEDGNSIALVREIRQILKEFAKSYPQYEFEIYTDTSIWIKNRLNTVISNIFFGLFLVFMSLLLTVNVGIAGIVGMGIPISFMTGLIVTDMLGMSLNMLSLLGALIALGMLVDEAIVVAENIYRHLELGKNRRQAVIVGSLEMFPAVLTATLTTVFAFLPLLLMSGEMGKFLEILPIMISVLLISSLFEAFYFLPLHAKDFLKPKSESHYTHDLWKKMFVRYKNFLLSLLHKKVLSFSVMTLTIIALSALFIATSRFQLFPNFDTTQIYVNGKVNINNALEDTEKIVTELENVILKNIDKEEVESVTSIVGFRMDAKNRPEVGEYYFHIFIDLYERVPQNFFEHYINPWLSPEYDETRMKRSSSAREIADMVQTWVEPFHAKKELGENVFDELKVVVPGAGVVANDVEIGLSGKDDIELKGALEKLKGALGDIKGVENIATDANEGEKEVKLRINSYGQQLGFNETTLSAAMRAFYLKGEYGKMFGDTGLLKIVVQDKRKDDISSFKRFEVDVPGSNQKVKLSDICDFIIVKPFANIVKYDGTRMRSVFATLKKEVITSAEVMKQLESVIKELEDEGFNVDIKGEEKENKKVTREIMQSALVALFLIFITLVWMFDSIKLSLIVISTIPLSILGVFIGHFIMGLNMTMPGMIGVVGLAGVVVNDGLIMASFIRKSKNLEELSEQAKLRLRPILLTSITTVLGLSTLIFFASGQSLILQPMAVSLGFGIAWATILNLFYVPLLYSIVFRVRKEDLQ